MLFDLSPLDLLVLAIMIILLFGPDKLPEVVQKVTGFLRKVREFSEAAKEDVRSELGPQFKDLELEDLHPKTFVRKHLLGGEGDGLGIEEIRSALDPRAELAELTDAVNGEPGESTERAARTDPTGRAGGAARGAASPEPPTVHAYDPDAT
ncbi:sec-independent protein translocase protein TatB [Streptomyces puniciscabiei]|uniref:Sec-independent protein translocase protein TatB n=1 Tax=Streptomyces puniciscabiei TaxID=164348 RepID=A0A542U837_9ACTN|nr:sec-independent translocase [Streptomyces puniciscabiei]TQK95252.1 sec-independent protein translocase protein TatB [Streptomyces puniciscabiei]